MSGLLLDTNCVSEAVSAQPAPQVMAWLDAADERKLFLSVFTLGEIRKGIVGLVIASRRRVALETWLDIDIKERFAGRILPVDDAVAERWGNLTAEMKRNGTPMPVIDAILTTALQHNLSIVSRNASDFRNAGVPVINPWGSA